MPASLALIAVLLAPAAPFESSIAPLSPSVQVQLKRAGAYRAGCPVRLRDLRLLTVAHRDFQGRRRHGQLVVNATAARPLRRVFERLYRLYFPIRHLSLDAAYGPPRQRPRDGDISGSFECRPPVPSPCNRGRRTGGWSNHAHGLAIDINPLENPYVGCGQSHDPKARSYMDRSRHRKGMITPQVVKAFAAIGWRWGGSWTGATKDYTHFSVTGR